MKRRPRPLHPPVFPEKMLIWIAGSANIDDLLGDMEENFYENASSRSLAFARWKYWKQTLSLIFSYALRKRRRDARQGMYTHHKFSPDMLFNYFKVAVRNLNQHRYFSVINAFGLAFGMSVSLLLISLYSYVSTYDDFHANKDRIYRVTSDLHEGTRETRYACAPVALADKIEQEFPDAVRVVRIVKDQHEIIMKRENIPVRSYYVDSDFFSLFSFSMAEGSSSLGRPGIVILTEHTAKRLFGEESPIGKTIEMEGGATMQVGGVVKDPTRTHLSFDMLVSYSSLPEKTASFREDWVDFRGQYVYVLLRETANADRLQHYVDGIAERQYQKSDVRTAFGLQHVEDIATGPDLSNAIGDTWDTGGMLVFAFFAALILLPACFNYANISIARDMRRAKEVALRKTLGGVRYQIFVQFVTETVVITLISLVGALGLFLLIRGEFQSMLVAGSSIDLSLTPRMVGLFIAFALITGIAAGAFPALYFARMNPVEALKSRVTLRRSSLSVRKVLTVIQFALSFGFVLSLLVFGRQYRENMDYDFGFDDANTLDVPLQDVSYEQVFNAFSQLAPVESVSFSSGLLAVDVNHAWLYKGSADSVEVAHMFVDHQYVSNRAMTFLAGRNFPAEPFHHERFMLVNEEFLAIENIASPQDAIGRVYHIDGNDVEIIGVLKNFHFASLNYPIGAFVFRENPKEYVYASLAIAPGNTYDQLSQIEAAWKKLPTDKKFVGKFFRDEITEAYETYSVLLKMVGFMGLMAITISLLGLIGMVLYTTASRTREVGIRKVMGASVSSVVYLLSSDYIRVLVWGIGAGIPATIFLLNTLMPHIQYYYTSISVWDVIAAVVVMLIAGIGTVAIETYKAAIINPATTLRSE